MESGVLLRDFMDKQTWKAVQHSMLRHGVSVRVEATNTSLRLAPCSKWPFAAAVCCLLACLANSSWLRAGSGSLPLIELMRSYRELLALLYGSPILCCLVGANIHNRNRPVLPCQKTRL